MEIQKYQRRAIKYFQGLIPGVPSRQLVQSSLSRLAPFGAVGAPFANKSLIANL